MPRTLSADQVRVEYCEKIPGPLGEAVAALYHNVAWLYSKWRTYRSLYDDKEVVDLLNATAGPFFHDQQLMLRESLFLHLCRLTDPPQSAGKDNLSLRALLKMLPPGTEPRFHGRLAALIDIAVEKTAFARVWRHKMLAHTALPVEAGGEPFAVPNVSAEELEDAIASIGAVMNCIELHYIKSEIAWDMSFDTPVGVIGLLHYLRTGLAAQREKDGARQSQ